jgi:hypothetical protein
MSTSTRTSIETTTNDFYTTILACTGSAAGIQNWASVIENGALKLDQVEGAFIASPEARQVVVRIVELGRGLDAAWVGAEGTLSLVQIATDNQLRRSPFSDDSCLSRDAGGRDSLHIFTPVAKSEAPFHASHA